MADPAILLEIITHIFQRTPLTADCDEPLIYMSLIFEGMVGGAKVLGKLSVPGRPTNLDDSRARAYCACRRCGWGLFGHFFSRLSFLSSVSLFGTRPDIN